MGLKGGNLPGTLTMGLSIRWPNGRTGTAALLLADIPLADYAEFLTNPKSLFVEIIRDLLLDEAWHTRVAATLR